MTKLRFKISMSVDLHGLELVRTVAAPKVTHLKFARRRA
jgi:hypothetical protein